MFVAGPPVVEWTHGKFEKNELGGSHIHTRNGAVDDEAASEDDAFERARRFLSYLPNSVHELSERKENKDDPGRARSLADRGGAARPAQGLQHAQDHRRGRRPGFVLRDRQALGPLGDHRLRAPVGLAGGAHGGRSDALRRRLDRARLGKDHALRRPGADLPPAGGAPGGRARASSSGREAEQEGTIRYGMRAASRDPAVDACPGAR